MGNEFDLDGAIDELASLDQEALHLVAYEKRLIAHHGNGLAEPVRYARKRLAVVRAKQDYLRRKIKAEQVKLRRKRIEGYDREFVKAARVMLNSELFKSISKAAWEAIP